MNKTSNRSNMNWIIFGSVPVVLLVTIYLALDINMDGASRDERATVSLIASCVFVLVSCVAIYKSVGWYKLLPAIGAILGILASAWFLFVLAVHIQF